MGWRFRKSKKILPGARLNFGKKGVGITLGTKHARYTIGADGRRTVSTSIPGTGLSYSEQIKAPSATPRQKGKELSEVPALPYFFAYPVFRPHRCPSILPWTNRFRNPLSINCRYLCHRLDH